jgi:TetR/AcrR family transcriptional regulator, cholesterol catabolism regulator
MEVKDQVKERILVKADELFSRYGIRSVSMDDIAGQLGISKKTLYQYFSEKEELVGAVFGGILEGNRVECTKNKKKADNAVHEIFLAFDMIQSLFANMNPAVLFDLEKYHPGVFKKVHEHKHGFMYHMIRDNLEKGVKEELYRDEIDIDILTRFRIESIMLPFNSEAFPENRTMLVKIEHEILDHFLYGICTPKGHKLIQKFKQQRNKK